jgi:hypothetical protein
MVHRVLSGCLAALALGLFAVGSVRADQADQLNKNVQTHEGKLVSVTGDKLVMTKDGKEHSHMLDPKAKIFVDGRAVKAQDLRPGMRIRVTTPKGNLHDAVKVEALDKEKQFTNTGKEPRP